MATQQAKNKAAGTAWESTLRDGLREHGMDVERLRLTGKLDEGDLRVVDPRNGALTVIEAKAGTMHAAQFVKEASQEARNYAAARRIDPVDVRGVAIVKARGKNWKDAYVLTTVRDYFGLDDA